MIVEMFWGERYYPDMPSSQANSSSEIKNLSDNIGFPSDTSTEARRLVYGLLESDPEKRIGSPNSPHGPIREHAFFKAGQSIDWDLTEEGIQKPSTKYTVSCSSIILSIREIYEIHFHAMRVSDFINYFDVERLKHSAAFNLRRHTRIETRMERDRRFEIDGKFSSRLRVVQFNQRSNVEKFGPV